MDRLGYKPEYRRHLPHLQPAGAPLFVTMRLHGSLPAETVVRLRGEAAALEREMAGTADQATRAAHLRAAHRDRFRRVESILDAAAEGPTWLQVPEIADLACESLRHRGGKSCRLHAFAVMPNHLHVVWTLLPDDDSTPQAMSRVLHSYKTFTASQANRLLDRTGPFWEHESYDHWIRDEVELERCIAYVLRNPVKAGLAAEWQDYRWCWAAT